MWAADANHGRNVETDHVNDVMERVPVDACKQAFGTSSIYHPNCLIHITALRVVGFSGDGARDSSEFDGNPGLRRR